MVELITSCAMGVLAIVFILGLFVALGMSIDPKGVIEWAKSLRKFYLDE